MADLYIRKIDETFCKIFGNEGIIEIIRQKYTFFVPGYEWDKRYKNKVWDGKIRLFSRGKLYIGLLNNLLKYLEQFKLDIDISGFSKTGIEPSKISEFIKINENNFSIQPRYYQINAVKIGLLKKRAVIISPTGSGKSFFLFLYIQYLMENVLEKNEKILLTVPTTSLVLQMQKDFIEYDKTHKIDDKIHIIMAGKDKDSDKQIYISTWQSIFSLDKSYFEKFKVLIFDECHGCKSDSLKKIGENCINAEWRLGCTGTLDEWKTNHMTIRGIIGDIFRVAKTKELIDKEILSDIKITSLIVNYPEEERKIIHFTNYQKEIKYLVNHKKRNTMLAKLAAMQNENTLILFFYKVNGNDIYKKLIKLVGNTKRIFYIDGTTKTEIREDIRERVEKDNINIIVANIRVFGTGINIKNLHNILLGHPFKSKIRILQAIGRGLRPYKTKKFLHFIDIIDNFTYEGPKGKRENYSIIHYKKRLKLYKESEFNYVEKSINL